VCSANMGTIIAGASRCPHLWGDVVLEVFLSDLKTHDISTESLTFSPDDGRYDE